jgi:2-polyprenyl-6-methoxyphenol hydroxylase-like FAD-dependent oxidoreductase
VGLRAGRCFGTPIAEYVPKRLIAGHVALIGDAAHVSSPMTGSGFHYALLDVLSLRQALAGGARGEAVALALAKYERARLADDRQLALYSVGAAIISLAVEAAQAEARIRKACAYSYLKSG